MPEAKQRLLSRIRAAVVFWGPAFLMLNLNPADRINPLVAGFAGRPIVLGPAVQQAMSGVAGRAWSSAVDPVAVALHFRAFVDAFLRHFLGYDAASRTFAKRRAEPATSGAFGKILAFHATYETNARGALHMHALLWAREFRCATLDAALVDERVREGLLSFLRSVSVTSLYDALVAPLDGRGPPPEDQAARRRLEQEELALCLTADEFNVNMNIADAFAIEGRWQLVRRQLRATPPGEAGAVWPDIPRTVLGWRRAQHDLIADFLHHVHSATCYKGRSRACRFHFPRACVERSEFTAEHGLRLARDRGPLTPYHDGLLLATRCNHASLVVGNCQLGDERERELADTMVEATIHVTRYSTGVKRRALFYAYASVSRHAYHHPARVSWSCLPSFLPPGTSPNTSASPTRWSCTWRCFGACSRRYSR